MFDILLQSITTFLQNKRVEQGSEFIDVKTLKGKQTYNIKQKI